VGVLTFLDWYGLIQVFCTMERSKIEKIESQKPEELWDKLLDKDSEENLGYVFQDVLYRLVNRPDLYYLETDNKNLFAIVRKRSDDSMIYETGIPDEIETLKQVGISK